MPSVFFESHFLVHWIPNACSSGRAICCESSAAGAMCWRLLWLSSIACKRSMLDKLSIYKSRNHCTINSLNHIGISIQFMSKRSNFRDYLLNSLRCLNVIGGFLETRCLHDEATALSD